MESFKGNFVLDRRNIGCPLSSPLPDMTGVALAQKMLRVRSEMPIILCTGHSEVVSADKAKEVGICEFVMKPMLKKELAETIRRALDRRKE